MAQPRRHSLRYYHFGATLVATGIAVVALAWVQEIEDDTSANLKMTNCNQGLLTLATLDIWIEEQIANCSEDLQAQLREEYR